ncbi:patatin-like phospholipase family protein [Lysobacter capsici]|uniref:patatin-like phospholipase family protein n=1 Tax=Lysobacter capsici TaxID=435897 RepID=UPI000BBB3AA2|nr:patatin-like phospholipase family protein [Lysobacter capsici]ATE71573.1 patatin [Lysobacter capsici]
MKMQRILSLDGGGIRGLVSCHWLAGVERALASAGKPGLLKHFDLIAGSSTGALVACGLAHGISPDTLAELYRAQRHVIFPDLAGRLWSRANRLISDGMSAPRYDGVGIEKVLRKVFGKTTLGRLKAPVLITSYDTISRTPVIFKSFDPKHRDLLVWEVCRASSAAPTYFPAHAMKVEGKECALIDGGVVANNPTACAIAEALRKDARVDNSRDLVVLSVGTGERTRSIDLDSARSWGALEWAVPIIDVLFDGNTDSVDYIARQLVGDGYYRMQAELLIGLDDLDDTSETNVLGLETLAKEYLTRPATKKMLAQLVKRL